MIFGDPAAHNEWRRRTARTFLLYVFLLAGMAVLTVAGLTWSSPAICGALLPSARPPRTSRSRGVSLTPEPAALLRIAERCPVHRTLTSEIRIETRVGSAQSGSAQ